MRGRCQGLACSVVDRTLRPLKARAYAPSVRALQGLSPDLVTVLGLLLGLAAAAAAANGVFWGALGLWWGNRLLDGLDGELARARPGGPRPAGAYLDLMTDLLVYATLPIGLAIGAAGAGFADPTPLLLATAATLASFYLNLGSWALLAPALPAPASRAPHDPGLRMPAGLMEGTETLLAFSLALAFPSLALYSLWAIAALTTLSALQRSAWGHAALRDRG
jgi:phosphatidylglycerophosphate synthase